MTPEQVLALAPDAGSAKAGRDLAAVRKWLAPGHSGAAAIWGEHQGSGSKPYRAAVDLAGPAFSCTCPSRKFPCKHGLGLLLLYTENASAFAAGEAPAWVGQWLEGRAQRSEKVEKKRLTDAADPEAAAKRAVQRSARVERGLEQTRLWLTDVFSAGLAQAQAQPAAHWLEQSKRLIDAQAPGAAALVREFGVALASGHGWQTRALEAAAQLHLLLSAAQRLDSLAEPVQADVRTRIGWTQPQEELRELTGVADCWRVLGQSLTEEDNLQTQRSWLHGVRTGQSALILHFAHASQSLDTTLIPGTRFEGELVYFPSNHPLRAIVKARQSAETDNSPLVGLAIAEALAGFGEALGRQPWLMRYPLRLAAVIPQRLDERWWLREAAGAALPVAAGFAGGWKLAALSGGLPLDLVAEWNGDTLLPLTAWRGDVRCSL